ncbi:MAG: hypothetical protein ABUS47_09300 [Steroidobacter sp.]
MTKTNRQWHELNRMPKNPTAQQRVEWHMAHAANCRCRPIPKGVMALMAAQGKKPPGRVLKRQ